MVLLQKITAFDIGAFNWLQARREMYKGLSQTSRFISRLGDGFLYVLFGGLAALLEERTGLEFLLVGLIAFAVELPLYILLKNTIRRVRPCSSGNGCVKAVIEPSDQFSFPSGHSAAAFVFATVLAHFYPAFALPAYFVAALIGFSRIMLGVHYPTDIIAGAALGVICAELAFFFW